MSAFRLKIPITEDSGDGFTMLKDLKSTFRQNLKMLIMTNPGEKVMDPNFGVGMQQFAFQGHFGSTVQADIVQRINEQVAKYIPVIQIVDIKFGSNPDLNLLSMALLYKIPEIGGSTDLIEFVL